MTRPPDDPPVPPSSSVADEAVRLVEALAGLGGARTQEDGHADAPPGPEPADRASRTSPGCTCDEVPVVASVCRVCPVCRVVGLLHSVQPETMERLADLLGMVAGSLQAMAADRRRPSEAAAQQPSRSRSDRDEVVEVTDADEPPTDPKA
ncbi:hypothetical protein [Luteipulveratus halotolerans]|uniref:Uncharacterized protein n=1 Tax=Luteipulveratus halotolerans TaxID=1631356 RepID=A0A0L6CHB3_9MICO|nr:hypothetical protein [Luteipulveratus halotolerans]KNX36955.1 hypothetical protein VV01_06995 [Luteipulveratus halotolerans]